MENNKYIQQEKKKNIKNILLIIEIIFGVIFLIIFISILQKLGDSFYIDSNISKCISEKSILYTSSTCGHCTEQEGILGKYKDDFNIINCVKDKSRCGGIKMVPSWFINGKMYEGKKKWRELRKITGC